MADYTKVLIVEDELTNAILLKRVLNKAGYSTVVAHSGVDALQHLEKDTFDAVLTDWMMPQIDGIELIKQMRKKMDKLPLIIMVTALVSEGARSYALESGADDYIAKPIEVDELLTRLKDGLSKHQQKAPEKIDGTVKRDTNIKPPFVGVFIATSTGGPPTLIELFKQIDPNVNAAFYVVQHGPAWMLETFSQRLQRESKFKVNLVSDGMDSDIKNVYIAPGDKHIRINKVNYRVVTDYGPKENFVRPAADPLFRSAAEAFGKHSIAVVLTGLGRDGTQGAGEMASVKAKIIVQDPETAVAPSMPNTVIASGINCETVPLDNIGRRLNETIFQMHATLKQEK